MHEKQQRSAHKTRRWYLGSLGLAAAGLGAASQPSAAAETTSSTGEFVVEQGDHCVPVVPISSDIPVEQRYGWGMDEADFSAAGLVDLQRPDTSILFLYDGPNGLSLVIVHDKYNDGTGGGSATFEFTGLPLDGDWAVQDDFYDGESNYDQWTRNGDQATVDWTWGENRTDGGAFRGLGSNPDLEIQIDPAFNAEATLYGQYYEGEITDWEIVSESADGPTWTSLALDEPIVLRRGTCSTDGTSDDSDNTDDTDDTTDDTTDTTDDSDSTEDTTDDTDSTEDTDEDPEDEEEDDEEDDDDHPGEGKGHQKGKGNGHEQGKGKGHDRHGDDESEDDDDHPGKGKGKGKEKGENNGKGKGKEKGENNGKGKGNGKGN